MSRNFILIRGASLILFILLIISSCISDPDSPGLEYMPDMYRSPAIETYVDYGEVRGRENKKFKSRLSARQTPKYTIPFYEDPQMAKMMLPNHFKGADSLQFTHGLVGWDLSPDSVDYYALAVNDTINPIELSLENAKDIEKRGEKLYTSMCMHCHGKNGDGIGPMVQSGAYVSSGIPNYKDKEKTELSNGQLFHSIYYGRNLMGAHGSMLNKEEIWTLVHYIRQFQDKKYFDLEMNDSDSQEDSDEQEMQ